MGSKLDCAYSYEDKRFKFDTHVLDCTLDGKPFTIKDEGLYLVDLKGLSFEACPVDPGDGNCYKAKTWMTFINSQHSRFTLKTGHLSNGKIPGIGRETIKEIGQQNNPTIQYQMEYPLNKIDNRHAAGKIHVEFSSSNVTCNDQEMVSWLNPLAAIEEGASMPVTACFDRARDVVKAPIAPLTLG